MLTRLLTRIQAKTKTQTLEKPEEMVIGEDFLLPSPPRRDSEAWLKRTRGLDEEGVSKML